MEHIEPPREGCGGESGRFRSAIVHDGKWDERVITQAAHTGSVSRKFIHGFTWLYYRYHMTTLQDLCNGSSPAVHGDENLETKTSSRVW